ncbi:MAG TPA: hypothetical protein VHQ90_23460 [Thermoanaerobaculia bacterium]|nr:hypothetical protein [Thermoanaerobaculia bacterium]
MPRTLRVVVFALTLLALAAGSGQALPQPVRPAPAALQPIEVLGDAWEWLDAHLLAPGMEWLAAHRPGGSAWRKSVGSMDPDGVNTVPPEPKVPPG